MPTADNPDLARAAGVLAHVRSATAFYPCAFDDPGLGLQRRLMAQLAAADVVHVFRLPQLVLNIAHKCMIWDIDELPWSPKPAAAAVTDPVYARGAAKVRVVMAASSRERPAGAKRFVVLPVAVPIPDDAVMHGEEGGRAGLLFVGNLNYLPNFDALVHLRDTLLPALIELMPDVRVTIVGRAPATDQARVAIDQLRKVPQFEFVFDAPDCAPYYRRCAMAITPIRLGGGTRVKILEAFAQGVPVVSTVKGCEGLDVVDGEQLLIADDPRTFARRCAEVLSDPALRARITAGGLAYVQAHHTQQAVDRVLAETIGGLFPD
jgi:glycosyltransferase involved in cell wall biosynthesis